MSELNNVVLTVCDVMGWQEEDVYVLNCWLEAYANLLGKHEEIRAIHCVKAAMALEGLPAHDINCWNKTTLTLIFYELVQALRLQNDKQLTAAITELTKQFSPHVNYAVCRFNNCFDAIDFEQSRDVIIAQAVKLLRERKI